MALRRVVKDGEDILRFVAKPVTVFDDKLANVLEDMKDTMFESDGVGIAAPQVGITRRIALVCVDGEEIFELINPVIIESSGSQIGVEGCLSVPNVHGYVERPVELKVAGQNRQGKNVEFNVSGFTAVAFCHEIDHLDGVLFTDKVIKDYSPDKSKK